MARMKGVMRSEPTIPKGNTPFDVDTVIELANRIFIEHNKSMDTIVTECCARENNKAGGRPRQGSVEPNSSQCDGARGICKHFYDSAPAGEYGTAHYFVKALMQLFMPSDAAQKSG